MVDDVSPVSVATALVRGHLVSLSIRAAVELGLLEALEVGSDSQGPGPDVAVAIDELAVRVGLEPAPLARLLAVLRDIGLVARQAQADSGLADGTDPGRAGFRLTPVGATFVESHPSRLRDLLLMRTERSILDSWQRLADAVRTDRAVFETVNGLDYWSHLADNPQEETRFNAAMARRGIEQAEDLAAAGALVGTRTLVDVGGGEGAMVAELVRRHPDLRGEVADRPEVAAAADAVFARHGLSDRARGVPADFFVEVPAGADAYVLCNVLHDWNDRDCGQILRTVRAAMTPGQRLWVLERHLDADRSVDALRELHVMDLHMLVMFGARERTRTEYDELLAAAGFGETSVSTGTVWDVLAARPV